MTWRGLQPSCQNNGWKLQICGWQNVWAFQLGHQGNGAKAPPRESSQAPERVPARLEPTISLSKGYVTLAGENDSNDSCSPGSTTALQSTPNSHKCYPEVKKLRVLGGFECQLSAGPPVVDRTSTAQQRSTSPKPNTTNNNRDRCIYHRIGCSYRFEICEWEMVRTGEERAHQSPGAQGSGISSGVICSRPPESAHPPANGQQGCNCIPELQRRHDQWNSTTRLCSFGTGAITGTSPLRMYIFLGNWMYEPTRSQGDKWSPATGNWKPKCSRRFSRREVHWISTSSPPDTTLRFRSTSAGIPIRKL